MQMQTIVILAIVGVVVGRDINWAGIALIKEMEGYRGDFYLDQVGVKTIGYGHACNWHDCSQIHPPISEQQATDLMRQDLVEHQNCIMNLAPNLNDNQFAACVSFSFNMGCGTFQGSHVYSNIRAGNYGAAAQAFNEYVSMGGRVIAGLVNRRKREQQLFQS